MAVRSIYIPSIDLEKTSDASNQGWGGVCLQNATGEQWSESEKQNHINIAWN